MNRKLKFKAKVKYNGYGFFHNNWIEGSLEIKYMGDYFIHYIDMDEFGNFIREISIEVLPETVCQYIKTVNGVEIYENDYYLIEDTKYIIKFSESELCYFAGNLILSSTMGHREITGNIHDKK